MYNEYKFANLFKTTLAADLVFGATSATLADASGLPTLAAPTLHRDREAVLLTIYDVDGDGEITDWETVAAYVIAGNVVTIEREVEGTAPASWLSGTVVEVRLSAIQLATIHQFVEGGETQGSICLQKIRSNPLFVADGWESIAFGTDTQTTSLYDIAFGPFAKCTGTPGLSGGRIAFGESASAIGDRSIAFGVDSSTDNFGSAFGYNAATTADWCSAFGYNCTADGEGSIVFGYNSDVAGEYSIVVGVISDANGDNSISMGFNVSINGNDSNGIGYGITIDGDNVNLIGSGCSSTGDGGTGVGDNTNVAASATALGSNGDASAAYAVTVGAGAVAAVTQTLNARAFPAMQRETGAVAAADLWRQYGTFEGVLGSEVLDLTVVAADDILVVPVPAGVTFYPSRIGIIVRAASGVVGQPTIKVGSGSGLSDVRWATALTKSSVGGCEWFACNSSDAVTSIYLSLTISAIATTFDIRFLLSGIMEYDT